MKNYRIREGSIAWYMKKYGRWVIAVVLVAVVMVVFIGANEPNSTTDSEEKPKAKEVIVAEKKTVANETEGFNPYEVPLSEDLQLYIYELSERYSVPMELIIAVIAQESNYDAGAIGDNGNSVGLMQVQYHQHVDRITEFNVTDLTNPYENVLVGVDYLAECIGKGGLEWGLMAYNGGFNHANNMTAQGVITEYAESVIYLSENL